MRFWYNYVIFLMLIFALSSTANAQNQNYSPFPSPSWAGYVSISTAKPFTSINGSWIVQYATPTFGSTFSSQWIGMGGYVFTGSNLIQIGTISDSCYPIIPLLCPAILSTSEYGAFYEIVPGSSPQGIDLTVKPGDKIHASIALDNNSSDCNPSTSEPCWKLKISDLSESEPSNIIYINYIPNNNSVEWIVESEGGVLGTYKPLAHFGVSNFGQVYTKISNTNYATNSSLSEPIGSFTGDRDNMSVGLISIFGPNLAYPSDIVDNTSFKVYGPDIPPLNLPNPTPSSSNINLGQSIQLADSGATGGSGYYSYNWLERLMPYGTNTFTNSTLGCITGQNTTSIIFNTSGCGATPVGI